MEICCAQCGAAMELPSGEDIVISDLLRIGAELGIPRVAVASEAATTETSGT
jgi:hypothetical protein